MAERPPYPGPGDDLDAGSDPGSTGGAPRWVYVFGIVALVLILLVVVLILTGSGPGGGHGPGRH